MNPRPVAKVGGGGASQNYSSGDRSRENLVVKRARVGVFPRWVTEREVLSATPLGSIEARGNGGRRPMGVGPVGLPLCRNKSVRVGWADVGGAEAWASYQSIRFQSGQYLSSDPGWWDLTGINGFRFTRDLVSTQPVMHRVGQILKLTRNQCGS
ncbi:hypothetical protein ACLOJK_038130 [Asimina triloba]